MNYEELQKLGLSVNPCHTGYELHIGLYHMGECSPGYYSKEEMERIIEILQQMINSSP